MKRLVLASALAAAAAAPVSAAVPEIVTVTFNPMVVCVTEPCYQPMPVTVCLTPEAVAYCTPK